MKRKFDYVTNSSSTSFCVWGISIDDCFRTLPEAVKKTIYDSYLEGVDKNVEEYVPSFEEFCKDPDQYTDWSDELDYIVNNYNLSIGFPPYGKLYIGESVDIFPDDMTIGEAKNKIKKDLKKIGFDQSIEYISECWYS